MSRYSRMAAMVLAMAAAALLAVQTAGANPSEDRRARVINDQLGTAYNVLVPGVNENGELNGSDLGTVTDDIVQVENSNVVHLKVETTVQNLTGADFTTGGFPVAILLYNGDVVVTNDSTIDISADGTAYMEASYTKPDEE